MFTRIAALARNIRQAREGAVAIHMALIFIAMLGMVALATDIGFALYKHRQMQGAADAAAFGAAIAKSTGYPATFATEAYADAAQVGFVNGANGVTITVNNPPVSPPASATDAANQAAVQVIITQPQTLPLVGLLYSGAFTLGVQAVATVGSGSGCALQLSNSANPGVTISNGATVTLKACGMDVCSTGSTALSISGGAALKLTDASGNLSSSQSVSVAGTASITNGATINNVPNSCTSPTCKQSQGACAPSVDPYAGVTMPTMPGGCSNGTAKSYGHSNSGLQTLSPGVWCNGVSFTNDAQILLKPGVYYVNGGNFNVGGAVVMNATGVTIVLTGSASDGYSPPYANVTIGNGATVTLSAPTTGATAGILLFGDRNAPAANTSNFGGGATMNLTGAIYFPSQTVVFDNGISNPSGCTQLIAGTIQFQGGAQFSNNCAGTGTSPIGGSGATRLIE
jgi:Flp pilus assembly protein TadG